MLQETPPHKSKETQAHETRILNHPLSDLHVLKSGDSFAVLNSAGNIKPPEHSPEGLFLFDTRLLSRWQLSLGSADLLVLNSCIDSDHVLFTVHLACKAFLDLDGATIGENDIYIRREQFLKKGTLFERLTIENHGEVQAYLPIALDFHADFYDMFQVRGLQRAAHGMTTEVQSDSEKIQISYAGLDNTVRSSTIRFSEGPSSLTSVRAEFIFRLKKGERRVIIITGGIDPGPANNEMFEETFRSVRRQLHNRLESWTAIKTGNERLDKWIKHSKTGIALLTTLRTTGLYPYAGIPWFSTPFGRDGIITALQTLWLNPAIAKGVLCFLSKTQATAYDPFRDAEPGKILHELRECEMAITCEVPYGQYYGSIDSTPLFVILAEAFFQHTNDLEFICELWPSIEAALRWIERDGDTDGDGFLEYKSRQKTGLYNQGWKDSRDAVFHADGAIAELPIAMCEVQAYAYAAYKAGSALAQALEKNSDAEYFLEKAQHVYQKTNEEFWSDELGCYALALDGGKKPCLVRSSNNGHMLWCGIAPEDRAAKIADMLMRPEFFTGWGIRTIAEGEARYNPLSYHNGSVWPHDTAIAAAGMARYGFHDKTELILNGLLKAAEECRSDWLPELFGGFASQTGHDLVRYPAACTLQAWACGSIFMALQASLDLKN